MLIKNIMLDSSIILNDVRIKFDVEYSNGDKSLDGYVCYDKKGKITTHCSPSIYMNKGNHLYYYLEFAELCSRLLAFEGTQAKKLVSNVFKIVNKYDDLDKELREKYNYEELFAHSMQLSQDIDKCEASLKRLKKEDKISETTKKLNDLKVEEKEVRDRLWKYDSESRALDVKRIDELLNVEIAL